MISAHELAVVAGVVVAVAVVGVATGALVLRSLRRRTIWASVAVVIATAALVMGAGVVTLSRLMLVSGDAFKVLVVAVVLAAAAAGLVAAALARRLARSSSALTAAAREVGSGAPFPAIEQPDTRELRDLAHALRTAASRLEESREREQSVEAARRELVAWVSHDLRSPVAGLRAMAEALEDGVVADAVGVAAYHRQMRRESVRLARMIDDLFELSGIHAGSLVVRPQRVAAHDVVDEVVQAVAPVAAARGVRVVGDADGAPVGWADPDQLARVLRNLVGNAVRHTPPGGTVRVSASGGSAGSGRPGDDGLRVAVRDECGGIPEADLARVFEVGYRGEWARTPGEDAGAGLGLAIARGIVDAHGGTIEVAGCGPGCCFTVVIPGAAEVATGIRGGAPVPEVAPTAGPAPLRRRGRAPAPRPR